MAARKELRRRLAVVAGLALVSVVVVAPGDGLGGDDATVPDRRKTCIYARGGLAPDTGSWPCDPSRPHWVGIDRRAVFSDGRSYSNFGHASHGNPSAEPAPIQAP